MTRTYEIVVDGDVRETFSADFTQASSQIWVGKSPNADSTPFQVADARHRPREAAALLIKWCPSQCAGWEIAGPLEEYAVRVVENANEA